MKRLFSLQPLLTTVCITALVDLAVAYGLSIPAGAKAPIITILTALGTALVHQSVASPATVAAVACKTAAAITEDTAGVVGTVTAGAQDVVDTVVSEVGGLLPSLLGKAA